MIYWFDKDITSFFITFNYSNVFVGYISIILKKNITLWLPSFKSNSWTMYTDVLVVRACLCSIWYVRLLSMCLFEFGLCKSMGHPFIIDLELLKMSFGWRVFYLLISLPFLTEAVLAFFFMGLFSLFLFLSSSVQLLSCGVSLTWICIIIIIVIIIFVWPPWWFFGFCWVCFLALVEKDVLLKPSSLILNDIKCTGK